MTIQLGQIAPDFVAETTIGPIRFHEWAGDSWVVLFSHPKNFTPVCTTELGEAARLKPEFDRRNVKAIGLSVDTLERHGSWNVDIAETQGTAVNFPMISDPERKVADLYGMVHPEADPSVTVRAVFVIDPARKVRLSMTYPPSTGRNFEEVLRVIDSLQLTDRSKVATPVNWQPGGRAIILPSVTDEQARERFPQGWEAQKPYLRWVDVKGS
jgi:alkyl hydroperoxide reductase subunit AhpC